MNVEKPSKELTGLCGEHFVAAMLAGYGFVVALPRGGAARADLFVAQSHRGRAIRVQVKTGRTSQYQYKKKYDGQAWYSWASGTSVINFHDESLWYAFVSLGDWPMTNVAPIVFFVPSKIVAQHMELEVHQKRTYFGTFEKDLLHYRGDAGIALLRRALS